jgi:ankyrin repeat protein
VSYDDEQNGVTALMIASGEQSHGEVVKMLIDAGADIDIQSSVSELSALVVEEA